MLHFETSPDGDSTPVNGLTPDHLDIECENPICDDCEMKTPVWDRTIGKTGKVEIGFSMSAEPWIAKETTQLSIDLALDNIVGLTPYGAPQIRTHSLSTTVLLQDGQQICIGGLKRTEDVKQTQKMPILGSIPVLGWLFGHEATVKRETEMVIVLTPTIRLGSEADLEMASDDDRKVRAQLERQAKLTLPKTEWGFDQWLIGND